MEKFDYNFDGLFDKENSEEESRKNFRISKCCANCKFYWYEGSKNTRGFCKLPNPQEKIISKRHGDSYDIEIIRATWNRSHSTNMCDYHQFRSRYLNIGRVTEWTGERFTPDGDPVDAPEETSE